MQRIHDLREILSAMQEIGNTWQAENTLLKAENLRLAKENQNLREESEKLRQEIENLSGKMTELKESLRDEIIKELVTNQQEIKRSLQENFKALKDRASAAPPPSEPENLSQKRPY